MTDEEVQALKVRAKNVAAGMQEVTERMNDALRKFASILEERFTVNVSIAFVPWGWLRWNLGRLEFSDMGFKNCQPLLNCSREIRLEALAKLPELYKALENAQEAKK